MTIDLRSPRQKNFLSVEDDFRKITERLMSSQNILKLLHYQTPDAIDKPDIEDNETLESIASNIRLEPDLRISENSKSFIIITFDNFLPNESNPKFLDNDIFLDILCPIGSWQMNSYMSRPFRIMHEINSLLDKTKLNGIGVVNFSGGNILNLGEYAGYQLAYSVINDV